MQERAQVRSVLKLSQADALKTRKRAQMSMEPTESRSMGRSYETERIAIERENGTHIHIYKNVLEKHLPFGIKISDEQIQKFYKKKIEEYPAVRE